MQLRVAPESNRVLMLVSPMLVLYVDVCISLMCIDSISIEVVAAVRLALGALTT